MAASSRWNLLSGPHPTSPGEEAEVWVEVVVVVAAVQEVLPEKETGPVAIQTVATTTSGGVMSATGVTLPGLMVLETTEAVEVVEALAVAGVVASVVVEETEVVLEGVEVDEEGSEVTGEVVAALEVTAGVVEDSGAAVEVVTVMDLVAVVVVAAVVTLAGIAETEDPSPTKGPGTTLSSRLDLPLLYSTQHSTACSDWIGSLCGATGCARQRHTT